MRLKDGLHIFLVVSIVVGLMALSGYFQDQANAQALDAGPTCVEVLHESVTETDKCIALSKACMAQLHACVARSP